jgi:signal transduction histidine kinase
MMRGDLSLANETQFLELIASGRPVPDVFLALCKFFEAAAAVWERREMDLKRSEAFLAQAQRLTKTGSVWWKPSSGEIKWSDGNYALMEYPVGVTPTVEMAFARCHPDDLELVQETLAGAIRDGSSVDFEHRLMMPGGAVKRVRFVVQNVAPEHEAPEFVGAATDITDWKQAEEKLRDNESHLAELRSELAHVARVSSLAMLTASIAHEVSQPLSGIVVNASTCLGMLSSEPANVTGARETVRRLIRDGTRASEVIARLRALFSRKPSTTEPVDLNDATRDVIALSRSELARSRALVRLELTDDIPLVPGDRVQLQQVILNLLRNASEAMTTIDDRPREIVIRSACWDASHVCLSVRDSGVGFEPSGLEKLFDPFYTTKQDGMGIGLSVSRSIIDSHAGLLWAVPNDGPGVTFTFAIPHGHQDSTNDLDQGATSPYRTTSQAQAIEATL